MPQPRLARGGAGGTAQKSDALKEEAVTMCAGLRKEELAALLRDQFLGSTGASRPRPARRPAPHRSACSSDSRRDAHPAPRFAIGVRFAFANLAAVPADRQYGKQRLRGPIIHSRYVPATAVRQQMNQQMKYFPRNCSSLARQSTCLRALRSSAAGLGCVGGSVRLP